MLNRLFIILIGIAFVGCSGEEIKKSDDLTKDVTLVDNEDTLTFSESDLESFIEYYNINEEDSRHPTDIYFGEREFANEFEIKYSKEAGLDSYYVLYTIASRKNKSKSGNTKRDNLISLYRSMNKLFCTLDYGGTHYGHMHKRILGIAEFESTDKYICETNSPFEESLDELTSELYQRIQSFTNEEEKSMPFEELQIRKEHLINLTDSIVNELKNEREVCMMANFIETYYHY